MDSVCNEPTLTRWTATNIISMVYLELVGASRSRLKHGKESYRI